MSGLRDAAAWRALTRPNTGFTLLWRRPEAFCTTMKHGLIRFILAGFAVCSALTAGAADPAAVSGFDNDVLCLRPSRISDNLAGELFSTPATNQFAGTILDLRFADGDASAVD